MTELVKIIEDLNVKFLKNNKYHNDHGPAFIRYFPNGQINQLFYFKDGVPKNGLSRVSYHENGNVSSIHYYLNGHPHSMNGIPSIIIFNKSGKIMVKFFHNNGKLDSNQPSVIRFRKSGGISDIEYFK